MKRSLIKKITTVVFTMAMVVGMVNIVSAAHAANGANVVPSNATWSWFSIMPLEGEASLDSEHNGHSATEKAPRLCWYHNLIAIGQVPGTDFATQGWVVPNSNAKSAQFFAKNTGWDGEYTEDADGNATLTGDNPWGLRFFTTPIPVEKGRSYTLSFKYKSDLKTTSVKYQKDEFGDYIYDIDGKPVPEVDENGNPIKYTNKQKHVGLSIINAVSTAALDFQSATGCAINGHFIADGDKEDGETITVKFTVPSNFTADAVKVQFTLGAFLKTYPEDTAFSGYFSVNDLKVTAGTQYTVKYSYGKQSKSVYVNPGSKVSLPAVPFAVKGKTFSGYKNGSAKYNVNSAVNKNLNLTCAYVSTPKPGKAKAKFKAQKKKVKLTLTKVKNCVGYQIKYADNKKMKKAKTKTTTKKTYTVKGLKSKKKTYFQIKGYNLDSAGKKVYSKKTLKKTVKVK